MLVGLVLPYLKQRGTEKQALAVARGLVRSDVGVILFVLQGWGVREMYEEFSAAGVQVVDVGPPANAGTKRISINRVPRLAWQLKKHRCDVIISRATKTNAISGLAGLLCGIPTAAVLSTSNSWLRARDSSAPTSFVAQLVRTMALGFPKVIISVSEDNAAYFSARFPRLGPRVRTVRNGVDVEGTLMASREPSARGVSESTFRVAYSGSLERKRKGLDVLLDAVEIILTEGPPNDIAVVLVGSGDDEDVLRSRVYQSILRDHVQFYGETDNPHAVVATCDAFVLPSRQEGMPNALLEAMATGVCCIAADCDTGPREIIRDGVNGRLVRVGDAKGLAAALRELSDNPTERGRMARAGQATVAKEFSHETVIDQYLTLITSLIPAKSREASTGK